MSRNRDVKYDPGRTPFDRSARQYNGNNALCLAVMANLSYELPDAIERAVTGWGFRRFDFFRKGGTEAFVAGDSEKVIVAFRGTQPTKVEDLATDVKIRMVAGPGGRVHRGFLGGCNRVWPALRQSIESFQGAARRRSLWLTGHSLGAALATVAAAKLRFEGGSLPVRGLYTFGQPRTGNQELADSFAADRTLFTVRFMNNNDIVTRLPPPPRYAHIGRYVYFTARGDARTEMGALGWIFDRLQGRIADFGELGTDGLKDHDMSRYVRLVRKHLHTDLTWS